MTEDELRAIISCHETSKRWCPECWQVLSPCQTFRLAKLALAGMRLYPAAKGAAEHGFMAWLRSALAEYEDVRLGCAADHDSCGRRQPMTEGQP